MKKCLILGFISASIILSTGNSSWASDSLMPQEPLTDTPQMSLHDLVQGNNAFGFTLFHLLVYSINDNENMVFSPYSISTTLAMAWVGARNNTEIQIGRVLHLTADRATIGNLYQQLSIDLGSSIQKVNLSLGIANSIWIENDDYFLQPFLDELDQDFYAPPMLVKFADPDAIRLQINQWVANHTNQKIENLFSPGDLTPTTKMVLVNAVYFKANWESPFQPSDTQSLPFLTPSGNVPVSMMQEQNKFLIAQNTQAQILEMPYQGGQISMVIILPRSFELSTYFQQAITPALLTTWFSQMKSQTVEVNLPKFKFSYGTVELKSFLESMGMTDAFTNLADFSGMTSPKREKLCIEQVAHKAFVNVDEVGTQAAAATGAVMHPTLILRKPNPPILFNANHPFIFLIRDNQTDSILFLGRVVDPKSE